MLKSKLYSKYFPIREQHTQFDEEEKKTLSKWVCRFKREVQVRELQKTKEYSSMGISHLVRFPSYDIDKYDEKIMVDMIQQNRFDDEYLAMLNLIIYRHKYNAFLSIFFFPMVTKENALSIFGEKEK